MLSRVPLFVTPWTAVCQASLSITNAWSLLKLMPITLVMPSNHLIPCHPLLLPPSIFPNIRVFSNEAVLRIRWLMRSIVASASVLPMNIQGLFPSEWIGFISDSPRDSQVPSPAPQFKSNNSPTLSFLYSPTHIHTLLLEKHSFD